MKRLEHTLQEIAAAHAGNRKAHPALMTHVVLGYPTVDKSIAIVKAMADAGAALIELQIPFSDPMADGPTIMEANEVALRNGMTVRDSFRAAEKLARSVEVPLLFMSYFNILYRYSRDRKKAVDVQGVGDFCRDAAQAGIEGLIIPDVPPEEHAAYWDIAKRHRLAAIPVVSPVSTDSRLRKIRAVASDGFVYCVTTTGTTGARAKLPPDTPHYFRKVRKFFDTPLAAGFGISSREQITALGRYAEIAIVGSAVIDKMKRSSPRDAVSAVSRFVRSLA